MHTFREDKIGIIILEKFDSTSGKYTVFFGEHFDGTQQCYDIGALNRYNGELTRRHYLNKGEAEEYWEDHFKPLMRGSGEYESDEKDDFTIISPD